MSNLFKFIEAVKKMRHHQRTFFSLDKGPAKWEHLNQAKVSEGEVDKMIEESESGKKPLTE